MHYHDIAVDYMVGAQLEGFDTMHLTEENDFIVLEGDEYLSSSIEDLNSFVEQPIVPNFRNCLGPY
jgi:hypothetical protein